VDEAGVQQVRFVGQAVHGPAQGRLGLDDQVVGAGVLAPVDRPDRVGGVADASREAWIPSSRAVCRRTTRVRIASVRASRSGSSSVPGSPASGTAVHASQRRMRTLDWGAQGSSWRLATGKPSAPTATARGPTALVRVRLLGVGEVDGADDVAGLVGLELVVAQHRHVGAERDSAV
jgi:hypothetical protein